MIRKTVSKSVALAAALTLTAGTATAFAGPPAAPAAVQPSAEAGTMEQAIKDARAFLAENGVDAAVIDDLISKFEAGQPWDSRSGVEPVETSVTLVGGAERTVARYADGSVAVTSVQKPSAVRDAGAATPLGVSECYYAKVGSTEYFDNCLVDFWDGIVAMSFRADYIARDDGNDSITSAYAPSYFIGGASSVDQTEFAVTRPDESVSGAPATARLSVKAFPMSLPIPFTFWVQLNVGYGGAYMTYSE